MEELKKHVPYTKVLDAYACLGVLQIGKVLKNRLTYSTLLLAITKWKFVCLAQNKDFFCKKGNYLK